MILARLIRRGGLVAALLVGGSLLATPAHANQACGQGHVAAGAKLDVKQPQVVARSWNGRRITVVAPSPVNPRFPTRGLDPMNVGVTGAQPDSHMVFQRQAQSHDADLPSCVGDCSILKTAAGKAAKYVTMFEFDTKAPSTAQTHNELVTDPKKVAWPNSRVLVLGKTRDGQEIPAAPGVVAGVADKQVQAYDAATDSVGWQRVSGRYLPSARAWIKAHNLFVSEPSKDLAKVAEGKKLLDGAAHKLSHVEKLTAEIVAEQAKPQQGQQPDYNRIRTNQAEIARLNGEISTENTQGNALVVDGEKIKVRVISVAGTPASAPMTTVNTRLQGENKPGVTHTASTTTDHTDGYASQEVEALHQDHLETTINFAPVANASGGSRATLRFRVPAATEKASFEMGGIKYYRVTADSLDHQHDEPAAL